MPRLPSDADLRAILIALIRRAGGTVEIDNVELYDAMIPDLGSRVGGFVVRETPGGIRVSLVEDED